MCQFTSFLCKKKNVSILPLLIFRHTDSFGFVCQSFKISIPEISASLSRVFHWSYFLKRKYENYENHWQLLLCIIQSNEDTERDVAVEFFCLIFQCFKHHKNNIPFSSIVGWRQTSQRCWLYCVSKPGQIKPELSVRLEIGFLSKFWMEKPNFPNKIYFETRSDSHKHTVYPIKRQSLMRTVLGRVMMVPEDRSFNVW